MSAQANKPFSRTEKTPDQTEGDIRKILKQYGAKNYAYSEREGVNVIEFDLSGLTYRFAQIIPEKDQKEANRLWRVFFSSIKSDLIADFEGLIRIQERWLWNTVNPENGQTFGDAVGPRLEAWRDQKALPPGEKTS